MSRSKLLKLVGTTMLATMLIVPNAAFASSTKTPADTIAKTEAEEEKEEDSQDMDNDQTEVEETDGKEDSKEKENDANEQAENAALAEKATVTEKEAIAKVKTFANLTEKDTVTVKGLESENGVVVYELNYTDKDGSKAEIKIDAKTCDVYTESDSDVEFEG